MKAERSWSRQNSIGNDEDRGRYTGESESGASAASATAGFPQETPLSQAAKYQYNLVW
jgi:hypothetical protein